MVHFLSDCYFSFLLLHIICNVFFIIILLRTFAFANYEGVSRSNGYLKCFGNKSPHIIECGCSVGQFPITLTKFSMCVPYVHVSDLQGPGIIVLLKLTFPPLVCGKRETLPSLKHHCPREGTRGNPLLKQMQVQEIK